MILPDGNSKKYIKTVIGVYILYTIISPIIIFATGKEMKLDYSKYEEYLENKVEIEKIEENINKSSNNIIEKTYKNELKRKIKEDIEKEGFHTLGININVDLGSGNITKLEIEVQKKESFSNVNSILIEKVEIDKPKLKENTLSRQEINKIKNMIKTNYGIEIEKITINSV